MAHGNFRGSLMAISVKMRNRRVYYFLDDVCRGCFWRVVSMKYVCVYIYITRQKGGEEE